MTNLDSKTELTEFAPLSPEIKQSGVSTIFSKFFKFSQDTPSPSEDRSKSNSPNSPSFYVPIEKDNVSGDSEWSSVSPNETEDASLPSSMSENRYRQHDNAFEARNLPNVLRRVSNLLALKNKNSPAYKDTNLKQYWMPDSVSKECYDCGEKFTTFRRRHHCRVCGQIFCSQCCNQEVPGKIIRCSGNLRVCTYCCKVVLSYLQSADIEAELSADLKALQDDLQSKFGHDHSISCEDDHSLDTLSIASNSSDVRRKVSFVYQEEKFASGGLSGNSSRNDTETSGKSELSTLNTLLQELVLGDNALMVRNCTVDGVVYECFWGSQLIDWLMAQRKTSSRTHSLAICQVLLDAKYIENVGQKSADFIDGGALYKFTDSSVALMEKPREDSSLEEISIPKNISSFSHSGFHLDLNIHENTVHISRQTTKSSNAKERRKSTFFTGFDVDESINSFMQKYLEIRSLNPVQWATVNESQLSEINNELTTYQYLTDSFQQHLQNSVHQLLSAENLALSWSKIIIDLVEKALKEIKIDCSKTDIINIGHYIKVKKISGGERKDSCLVGGIVCTKNVAHKEMNIDLVNPRILLLQCPIVYQRVEGRLMSLEPVMMQEKQYLRHTVARIAALKPDLVLVHRNVSRLAQESLNSLNITLVLNVKMQVMERVARCTNADILTAIDAHVGTTQLGTCRSFHIREMPLKNGGFKTLMFFEGCAFPQLGCTLLLRGASEQELKKLKTVTKDTVFMYYNAKLEKSFLMDEFAKPPTVPSFTFIEEIVSPKHAAAKFNQSFDLSRHTPVEEKKLPEYKPDSGKCERKFDLEEKRASTKSVVDHDDPLHFNSKNDDDDVFLSNQDSNELSFKEEPQQQNKFRMALRDTVLSYSPYIVFNLPYLETKTGQNCELRKYFPDEIYQSMHFSDKRDGSRVALGENTTSLKTNVELYDKKPPHELVHAKLKTDANNEEVQSMLAFYRAKGGRYSLTKKNNAMVPAQRSSNVTRPVNNDFLDPRNHQRLPVLFCSFSNVSNNAPEFCVHPWIVNMDFYGCNDIPLGNFLEKYCFRKSYICPSETCDTSMIEHERRFVHDAGCVHIVLRELNTLPEKKLPILLWNTCTICKSTTPISAMSSDTWSLSFAKYLELRFHAGKYTCRVDNACEHSLHHDYCQYFYYKSIIATFKYTDILLWELSLPPKILKIQSSRVPISVVMEQVKEWAVMGHEIFSSILEKLCWLDYDDISMIQSLKKHLSEQQAIFKQKVDDIQVILTSPTSDDIPDDENLHIDYKLEDSVVLMKKSVADVLSHWNSLLAKLESQKKDSRQKTKSMSTDVKDNIPSSVSTSSAEESANKRDSRDESVISEDYDVQDLNPVPYKSDNSSTKSIDNRSTTDVYDGSSNQSMNVSLSSETLGSISQTQTPDKITMKMLFSQLLPNSFQNNPSLLSNPINTDEHYSLNVTLTIPIVVYETEPSSIIACALATIQYQNHLDEINKSTSTGTDQTNKSVISKKVSSDGISTTSAPETAQMTESDDSVKLEASEDSKLKSTKTNDSQHIEIQFNDSTANFNVKVYFAQQFKDLRSLVFPSGEEVYIRSLSRCIHWNAHGGKSGSMFCKTKDDRFILKEMGRLEIQPFLEFAPHYFNFIQSCYSSHQPTLLGKIVGVYRVKYKNNISNLLVMENLFYTRDIIRKFDLKGSVRNRLVDTQTCPEGELVLLDENLINMTCESPLYVYPHSKTVLMQAINNDVTFLASQSVMDYSLLVGLDEVTQELVVGIIDYIRTFTWDKKLETFVKKSGILGGQGKLPTIVSPEKYKSRFITAMHKYFFAVPDQWLGLGKGFDY